MKSVKLVSMLGAIGTFLAAGVATAATTESLMQQREGVAAEQNAKKLQDFQAALPARMALVNSVIDQFRAEFARDSVNGAKRLNQFAQQVHSTPSSVLQVTRFSRNVAEFADQLEELFPMRPEVIDPLKMAKKLPRLEHRLIALRRAVECVINNLLIRSLPREEKLEYMS